MANVTFAHGVASSPLLFLAELEDMAVLAHLTRAGATRAVLVTDTQKFILTGADFTTTRIDGVKTLTGGTLDQVVAFKEGAKLMTVTRLGLDLTDLLDAAMAETTALNTGAVETLLYPPGWTCTGNRAPDNLAVDATSGDGVVST